MKLQWNHTFLYSLLLFIPFDLISSLGMDLYLPALGAIKDNFNVDHQSIQLTLAFYMVALGLGQILFGPLSDAVGRRPVITVSAFIYSLASFAMAFSSTFGAFLSFRILQSFAASAVLVVTFATVRDVFAERKEGTVIYALMGSILAFVPAVAPLVGALIQNTWGWQGIFLFLGGFSLLIGIHTLFAWTESRPDHTHPFQLSRIWHILTTREFLGYTLAYASVMGAFFVYFSKSPTLMMDNIGLDNIRFSLWFGSVAIVMIITTRFVGALVEKWGTKGIVVRGLGILLLGAAGLFLAEFFFGLTLTGLMLPMYLVGVGISLVASSTANGALRQFSRSAGTATALYFACQSLFLTVVGSLMINYLPPNSTWAISAYILVAAFLAWAVLRKVSYS